MTKIIREPSRFYPHPQDITDLDYPHPEVIRKRYTRMSSQFRYGYDKGSGDNPTIVKPPKSPSTILSKL